MVEDRRIEGPGPWLFKFDRYRFAGGPNATVMARDCVRGDYQSALIEIRLRLVNAAFLRENRSEIPALQAIGNFCWGIQSYSVIVIVAKHAEACFCRVNVASGLGQRHARAGNRHPPCPLIA